jgi:hypothetical protein
MAASKAIPLIGLLLARPSLAQSTEPPSHARLAVGVLTLTALALPSR